MLAVGFIHDSGTSTTFPTRVRTAPRHASLRRAEW